jgi:hypothetical protein
VSYRLLETTDATTPPLKPAPPPMVVSVGVLYVGGRWTGTTPDLPGWVATSDLLGDLLDLVAAELQHQSGEPVEVRVVHVPAHR